jgi:hypothetical protein
MCELFDQAEAAYRGRGVVNTSCAVGCNSCPFTLEADRPPPTGEVVGLEQLEAMDLGASNVIVAASRLGLTATAYLILRAARRGLPVLVCTERLGQRAEQQRCLDIFEAPTVPIDLHGEWWKRTTLDDSPPVCGRRVIAGALSIDDWLSMTRRAAALTDIEFRRLNWRPARARRGLLIVEGAPDRTSALPRGQAATWITGAMPHEGIADCRVIQLRELARPPSRVEPTGPRAQPCQLCLPL